MSSRDSVLLHKMCSCCIFGDMCVQHGPWCGYFCTATADQAEAEMNEHYAEIQKQYQEYISEFSDGRCTQ